MLAAIVVSLATDLQELRAVWLADAEVRALAQTEDAGRAIDMLADAGANAVVVDVWSDPSKPAPEGLPALVFHAHRRGLELLAAFDPSIACASEKDCTILRQHPEWAARKKSGACVISNGLVPMNLLETGNQELVLKLVLETCRDHEIDGIVCGERMSAPAREAGYEVETARRYKKELARDPPADANDADWTRWRAGVFADFLARIRKEVKAVDASLVVCVAPRVGGQGSKDWIDETPVLVERGIPDAVFPRATTRGLAPHKKWIAELAKSARASSFPVVEIELEEWRKDAAGFLAALAADKEAGFHGELLVGLAALREHEEATSNALRNGPWAELAFPPWRGGKAWRAPAPVVAPAAGEGNWSWHTREREPVVLELDGGETGHAVWTMTPPESGNYGLYVWVSPKAVRGQRAPYRIASTGGMRTIGIDVSLPRNTGWLFLGEARLEAEKPLEVARLTAEEKDFTKVTTAGPLVALLRRRTMPR